MPRSGAAERASRPTRSYDPAHTLEQLIKAGIDLFGRQGFHATSVREIVDAAGLTKGAFYHHFESKEDLLHMIHDEFIDFHLAGQAMIFEEVSKPHERLYHLVRLLVTVVTTYTGQVSVYFRDHRALADDSYAEVHAKRTEARNGFVTVIADGMQAGDFRPDMPPELAAFAVLGMGNWIHQWYSSSTPWSAEMIGRQYGLMALRSLTAKPRVVNGLAARPPDPQRDPITKLLDLWWTIGDDAVRGYSLDVDQRRRIARRASIASGSSK